MTRSMLCITEGRRDEPDLLKHIIRRYDYLCKYEIASTEGSLYELMDEIFSTDDDIDTVSPEIIFKRAKILDSDKPISCQKYTDIILIFDMDPHYQKFEVNKDRIRRLLEYFDDSTGNGKLYINYPMSQAFYHIADLNSESYLYLEYKGEMKRYKDAVNREGGICKKLTELSVTDMNRIIQVNLKKTAFVLGKSSVDNCDDYDSFSYSTELWDYETELWKKGSVSVICTMVFFVIDYNSESFFNQMI